MTYDDIFVNSLMYIWFEQFVNFYSTNGTMDPVQIKDTIDLVREEYPHYKPEDFKLFFKMAKKGYFGQVFGRIDGEVIMNWMAKYDIHRDTQAQNEAIKAADAFRPRVQAKESIGLTWDEYQKWKKNQKSNGKSKRIKGCPFGPFGQDR